MDQTNIAIVLHLHLTDDAHRSLEQAIAIAFIRGVGGEDEVRSTLSSIESEGRNSECVGGLRKSDRLPGSAIGVLRIQPCAGP